jgi:hypothetical protein
MTPPLADFTLAASRLSRRRASIASLSPALFQSDIPSISRYSNNSTPSSRVRAVSSFPAIASAIDRFPALPILFLATLHGNEALVLRPSLCYSLHLA